MKKYMYNFTLKIKVIILTQWIDDADIINM